MSSSNPASYTPARLCLPDLESSKWWGLTPLSHLAINDVFELKWMAVISLPTWVGGHQRINFI